MKVLFVSWELAPFFKLGGLGDISKSLPKALSSIGVDIRVIVPFYKVFKFFGQRKKKVNEFFLDYDGKKNRIEIYQISFLDEDIPVYLLKNADYLSIPFDDTFPFFNLAITKIIEKDLLKWTPEIIHCNDHHTGLIPFLIKHNGLPFKTLFTIHNLIFQGQQLVDKIEKMGIDSKKCRVLRWEIKKRQINFLTEAIIHTDLINTVSPTYAKEILTEEYGAGLDEILNSKKDKIYGILNGIDYDFGSPLKDKNIIYHYKADSQTTDNYPQKIYSVIEGKKLNKLYLQEKLGLSVNEKIPLFGFIGRFDAKQKGLDIMHKMLRRLNFNKYQFVFLGHGDENWETRYFWFSSFYPKSVYCRFEFNEKLASQIYAAADFLLIPSKFEPCGLIQMIAMRYGTLPIARATGGLKDSIEDGVDGFLFDDYSSSDLERKLKFAIKIWREDKKRYHQMVKVAMNKDFSWDKSAKEYLSLYQKLLEQ